MILFLNYDSKEINKQCLNYETFGMKRDIIDINLRFRTKRKIHMP